MIKTSSVTYKRYAPFAQPLFATIAVLSSNDLFKLSDILDFSIEIVINLDDYILFNGGRSNEASHHNLRHLGTFFE